MWLMGQFLRVNTQISSLVVDSEKLETNKLRSDLLWRLVQNTRTEMFALCSSIDTRHHSEKLMRLEDGRGGIFR